MYLSTASENWGIKELVTVGKVDVTLSKTLVCTVDLMHHMVFCRESGKEPLTNTWQVIG